MTGGRNFEQWPTYDDKSLKGDLGVALVKLAVAKELRWAFRDKPQIDLGLDGEIEVREPHALIVQSLYLCRRALARCSSRDAVTC